MAMTTKQVVGGLCLGLGMMLPCCGWGQAPVPAAEQAELTQTITALDTKLFDAYNRCDLKTLGAMVSDDLEFYHDQTGLQVGKAPFLESIKKNICGKVQRTLVPGTLEAHRLKGFGAVEIGTHRFRQPGHSEEGEGEAKFVMIWKDTGGVWLLTRVISYDHASLTK
jgi:ketosteroid isomerase-like protein